MKKDTFQAALTNVNDKYIEEAATVKKRTSKAVRVWRGIAIAACALLVTSGVFSGVAISALSGGSKSSSSYYYSGDTGSSYYDSDAAYSSNEYAAGGGDYYYEAAEEMPAPAETTAAGAVAGGGSIPDGSVITSDTEKADASKIIYTAEISMQSKDFDNCIQTFDELVSKYGAYYESKTVYNGNSNYRNAYVTIRVPVENYSALLEELAAAGTVVNRFENAEDVSEAYNDIESKLETAKTKLERLQELLKEAEDIEDIITIESYISDAEYTIEYYQGLLNGYDSRISYSTINVTLNEVYKVEPQPAPMSFGEKLAQAFSSGIEGFTDGLQELLLFFAEAWTWLLFIPAILGIIPVAIILIVKAVKRKRNR